MVYRVFDTEKRKWLKDNIYMNPNGDLFLIKQFLFGMVKIPLMLDSERYVCHRAIDLWDKNGILVHEGDYLRAKVSEDRQVAGVVVYAQEISSYVIICVECDEYFTLGNEISEYIEVIGNVFDGYNEVKGDDEQTLSESEE